MKIQLTAGWQFKTVSLIPGIDISWYSGLNSISLVLAFWIILLTFSKGE